MNVLIQIPLSLLSWTVSFLQCPNKAAALIWRWDFSKEANQTNKISSCFSDWQRNWASLSMLKHNQRERISTLSFTLLQSNLIRFVNNKEQSKSFSQNANPTGQLCARRLKKRRPVHKASGVRDRSLIISRHRGVLLMLSESMRSRPIRDSTLWIKVLPRLPRRL